MGELFFLVRSISELTRNRARPRVMEMGLAKGRNKALFPKMEKKKRGQNAEWGWQKVE
jgi:hypothetical protein